MNLSPKKYFATFLLFVGLGLLPISCGVVCNDSCGCQPDFEVLDFNITEMEALTLVANGQQVSPEGTFPYNQVVKAIRIKDFQTVSAAIEVGPTIPGVAYACSPIPPKSTENLVNIQIINLKEFTAPNGQIYTTGDDISDFFGMNYYFEEGVEPIGEFLSNGLEMYADELYKLAWLEEPREELNLVFTIRVQLESGREFSLTDEMLNLI